MDFVQILASFNKEKLEKKNLNFCMNVKIFKENTIFQGKYQFKVPSHTHTKYCYVATCNMNNIATMQMI